MTALTARPKLESMPRMWRGADCSCLSGDVRCAAGPDADLCATCYRHS